LQTPSGWSPRRRSRGEVENLAQQIHADEDEVREVERETEERQGNSDEEEGNETERETSD
jgi:hypothetical protein